MFSENKKRFYLLSLLLILLLFHVLKEPGSECLSRMLERAKLANLQILKCILKRAKALLPKVA